MAASIIIIPLEGNRGIPAIRTPLAGALLGEGRDDEDDEELLVVGVEIDDDEVEGGDAFFGAHLLAPPCEWPSHEVSPISRGCQLILANAGSRSAYCRL